MTIQGMDTVLIVVDDGKGGQRARQERMKREG